MPRDVIKCVRTKEASLYQAYNSHLVESEARPEWLFRVLLLFPGVPSLYICFASSDREHLITTASAYRHYLLGVLTTVFPVFLVSLRQQHSSLLDTFVGSNLEIISSTTGKNVTGLLLFFFADFSFSICFCILAAHVTYFIPVIRPVSRCFNATI